MVSLAYRESLYTKEEAEKIVSCLAMCESSNNEKAINPRDTDGLPAKGLLQFKQQTFDAYCYGDIWSGQDQKTCATNMIQAGLLSHWGRKCRERCRIPQ